MACRKKRFGSDTEAQAVLAILKFRKSKGKPHRREKAYYYCAGCRGWHLTSEGTGNKSPAISEAQRAAKASAAKNKKGNRNGKRQ